MKKIEDLIRKESSSAERCEKTLAVLHEILTPNGSLVEIDSLDVEAAFEAGSEIMSMDLNVQGHEGKRMLQLVDLLKAELTDCSKVRSLVVRIFCPKDEEITMDEMGNISHALNALLPDANVVWGLSYTENGSALRIAMLYQ